jgi:hypothetical protein
MRIARLESRLALAVLLAVVLLAVPSAASANVGERLIDRCTHGESLSGFSQSAYAQALNELSAGTEEYSDCSSLIRQAQIAAATAGHHGGGGGGSSGSGGGTGAVTAALSVSPAERESVTQAGHGASAPVQFGGQTIAPGVVHTNVSSALSSLPTPLLATLVFLLASLVLVGGGVLRNRVRAGRSS